MVNIEKFQYAGESQGYHYWIYKDGSKVISRLYISKWRVPDTTPNSIYVSIRTAGGYLLEYIVTEKDAKENPSIKNRDIVAVAHHVRVSKNGDRVRYDARGNSRPIRSIYIPHFYFDNDVFPQSVQVVIEWR